MSKLYSSPNEFDGHDEDEKLLKVTIITNTLPPPTPHPQKY
jgi:hypothetical protein